MFLFQLPPILPEFESVAEAAASAASTAFRANANTESRKDDKADNQQKDSKGTRHLEGMVGKLVVYKSGETKLKLGNIELDVCIFNRCLTNIKFVESQILFSTGLFWNGVFIPTKHYGT